MHTNGAGLSAKDSIVSNEKTGFASKRCNKGRMPQVYVRVNAVGFPLLAFLLEGCHYVMEVKSKCTSLLVKGREQASV